ncbi:MAG: SPOR domain-containing protein [Treponema sp.]|nr:SPOR domain-containing protein [Treponema sp.]MCL2238016.1 SPOR domain-containing protein [Treponema sp.]
MIKPRERFGILFALAITVFIFAGQSLFAQTGVSLEAEIQNIENTVNRQGISAADRHDALLRLARLKQLSGDIEGAARNWLEAATAIPGRVNEEALLSCAYCLAAMGEWDRAATALEPLVARHKRARFLDLGIRAVRSGDVTALSALADNPEYAEMKTEIYFILWKVSRAGSGENWRRRLASEFPQTPEGRLAAGESSTIIVRPSPFWLFANGLDSLPVTASIPSTQSIQPATQTAVQPTAQPATQSVQPATQSVQPATQPAAPVASQPTAQSPLAPIQPAAQAARLQTGIYGREANAQAQMTNLRNAGFSPSMERRTVNGNEMFAVTVPAGANQTQTMEALRTAGFESFPIR